MVCIPNGRLFRNDTHEYRWIHTVVNIMTLCRRSDGDTAKFTLLGEGSWSRGRRSLAGLILGRSREDGLRVYERVSVSEDVVKR